ncbi:hypothetical protein EST38_g5275 [Candolleomyces aberdarensis]|uniref:Uncharacterized protein n=1 Tax=Candolleomyces aberdarensis TaxID=2316362 RepID=A0A4Q2DKW2_9AGAR|nr:hypothetical protein EST38_g5275 [Candolleomyces aberdarensis]
MSSPPESPTIFIPYVPDELSDDSDDEKSAIELMNALSDAAAAYKCPGDTSGSKSSSDAKSRKKSSSKPSSKAGSKDRKTEKEKAVKAPKPASKRKKDDLSDDSEEAVQVTAYVHIATPTPKSSGKSKKATASAAVIRGPCIFDLDATFPEFKRELAGAVECRVSNLPKGLFWTYDKPANDSKKPLLNLKGYDAMITSLTTASKKAANLVIKVHMPPPATDDVNWETPSGEHVLRPYDHEEELAKMAPELRDTTAKAQIAAMQEGSAGHLAKLHNRHIIDNHPDYPNKRILERAVGNNKYRWELTPLRLQIWANALSRGEPGVTVDVPPNSAHFDISKAMKTKPAGPAMPDAVPSGSGYPYPFPPYGGFPYPFMPGPVPPLQYPAIHYPVSPTPARNIPRISLEEFCTRYEVSAVTLERLQKLEYQPGDSGVEKLPQTEWEKAGFTWLGWNQFLKAHRLFMKEATM